MGAIDFNPAQVMKKLLQDRAAEFSRLAALAGGQAENEPAKIISEGQNRQREPANPANLLISGTENRTSAPANPANLLNGFAEWRDGFAKLDPNRPPANFPSPWWRGIIRDAELFLPTWARQAAILGWTTLDLFGAHPRVPTARYSCMGLLLLVSGGRVVALTAESAVTEQQSGSRLTYTRHPPEAEHVALWELARE